MEEDIQFKMKRVRDAIEKLLEENNLYLTVIEKADDTITLALINEDGNAFHEMIDFPAEYE